VQGALREKVCFFFFLVRSADRIQEKALTYLLVTVGCAPAMAVKVSE
jgi:hypothetical protein